MTNVFTTRGPVDVNSLGGTLSHEHVFAFHADTRGDYPWSEETEAINIDAAVDKLQRLKDVGINTLVDTTVFGLGRNVGRVAKVAERAEFNVIVATGVYGSYVELPIKFRFEGPKYVEELFVREITEGIGETGIRPGILKCATDAPGVTIEIEIALRAVARASVRTGTPITTHTNPGLQTGLIQQAVFAQEGVDLSNVIIGHSCDTKDLDYLERLLDAGSYLGMDRFGLTNRGNDRDRVETVAALCRKGYASRMVLSHDAMGGGDIWSEEALREWRWGHIPTKVLPALREAGVSDDDIDTMMVKNPREFFGHAGELRESLLKSAAA